MTQIDRGETRQDAAKQILEDIQRRAPLPPDMKPEDALSAVMCTFMQHVTGGEARHVFAALPHALQPMLETCMIHRGEPASRFDRDELIRRISGHLHVSRDQAEDITSAVLTSVSARLPARDVASVAAQLPRGLQGLWVVSRPVGPPVEPHPILGEIERCVALPPGVTGAGAFAAVLGTLSHRLTLGEARHLVESLPPDLRPLLEGYLAHRGEAPEHFGRGEYLQRVARTLKTKDAEPIVRAVFRAVQPYLWAEIIEHVNGQLPADVQDLWMLLP